MGSEMCIRDSIYILNNRIPRHKKWGRKSSSSASKWLTIHQFENEQECFEAMRKNYDKVFATHLSSEAVSLYEMDLSAKVALVFGNEHSGVTDETLQLCDGNFIIPQVGIINSLNISVTCAVTLYEAMRQKTIAGHYEKPQHTGDKLNEIQQRWDLLNEFE